MKRIVKSLAIIISFILVIFNQTILAQVTSGGEPYSWSLSRAIEIESIVLPKINDYKSALKTEEIKSGAFEFAKVIDVNISNIMHGNWEILSNGDKIWTISIVSVGAYSLNFTFSKFIIPDGANVYIYTPDKSAVLGAFTSFNHKKSHSLAVFPLQGDEIIIEYYEPENSEFEGLLEIEKVGHDYKNVFGTNDNRFGLSGDCNVDINCIEGVDWQKEKRAVCRMIVDNSYLCTGTLINNFREDETPFLLSANHCVDNQRIAENTVFCFNYESAVCNGEDGEVWQTISGSDLISTKNQNDYGFLDFTLLKLSINVPDNYYPYFAGWDSRENVPTKTTSIHHPQGDVKKISVDNDSAEVSSFNGFGYDDNTFWKVLVWDVGTTEDGSSGGPLFDQNRRIVGSLTGGEASCGNSVNDLFQMFSASYDSYNTDSLQLKKWLDPDNTGIKYIDGFESVNSLNISDKLFLHHFDPMENKAFVTADGGYVSGNNVYEDIAKAEYFSKTELDGRNYVVSGSAFFYLAKGSDETEIEFFIMDEQEGKPGDKIGSKHISLKDIKEDVDSVRATEFDFYPPISINTPVYFGVTLPQTNGDSLALFNTDLEPEINYAWEQNSMGEWLPYSSDNSWGGNWINYIGIEVGLGTDITNESEQKEFLKLYPNPVYEALTIVVLANTKIEFISVYNSLGRLISRVNNVNNTTNIRLNVLDWDNGFYIVRAKTPKGIITSKFIKQ